MLSQLAKNLFGSANDRVVRRFQRDIDKIAGLEPALQLLSDAELAEKTTEFRDRIAQGQTPDQLLHEAFAVVREASRRVLGMRHFDVQLIGGIVLHRGMIAEMKTGEGKTLVATLPAYLNALSGQGVHIVTVNDYLAQRDAAWMGKIFQFLGLSTGVITHALNDFERKAAYASDIVYATNNELGFDYLRDNMKYHHQEMVQRPFHYAIIDEVDSILIDEARTPLIISGPTEDNSELYSRIDKLIPKLSDGAIEKDEKSRSVTLNEQGVSEMEGLLVGVGLITEGSNLYDIQHVSIVHHVNQALKAHYLFQRDVDYIVKDNKVIIIDEFTGRMMEGRRYSDGLHQALEAKENAHIQNENQTLASITFQNYFRLYPKLSGMTGTAMTEAAEFADIYRLEVIEIPTNVPVARLDEDDVIYRTSAERDEAVIELITRCHLKQQPILVGTVSIEKSEALSRALSDKQMFKKLFEIYQQQLQPLKEKYEGLVKAGRADSENSKAAALKEQIDEIERFSAQLSDLMKQKIPVPHQVLNARYHEKEAHIIAQAGRPGAVTIATNMAGRGTDIQLGGNLEMRLADDIPPDADELARKRLESKITEEIQIAKQTVKEAGGLFVIGTERHESRRIDNQLRGRSGRQGDPGASRFFISLQDDLMRIFGSERMDSMLQRMGMQEGESINHPWMNKAIERAQSKVEQRNYEIRKNLLKFDDVMNDQRKVIYEQRIELMDAEDLTDAIDEMRAEVNEELISRTIPARSYADQWDIETLEKEIYRIYGLELPVRDWAAEEGIADSEILERLQQASDEQMATKRGEFAPEIIRLGQKRVLLETLDQLWKDHLLTLDQLRQGIGLRAYGQRDPLNEYKQEAFGLFEHMLYQLREMVTQRMAHLRIRVENPEALMDIPQSRQWQESRHDPANMEPNQDPVGMAPVRTHIAAKDRVASDPSSWGKVARNEPCPCGSGKKYKQCHGAL